MQDVVELTDPDAPVKLNEDGILAIHVALGLSNTEMEKMQGLLVPMLDPHGTGTLTRKAWRAVSAEWHASGKSFLDFITTARKGAPLVTTVVNGDVQHTTALETVTTLTGGSKCAAEEEETKATAID